MDELGGRHAAPIARLVDAVLASPGHTANPLRRTVFTRALGSDLLSPAPSRSGGTIEDLPPALASYVDKVAHHAYKVTDEDVVTLQRAGNSDDAVFELTVSAALGAALLRLERGLAALRGESSRPGPPGPLSASTRGETKQPR